MAALDLSLLQASAAIAALPDDTLLTTDEAAIFLRQGKRTLEQWRQGAAGPRYRQGGVEGAKGVNQKVTYKLGDLKAWNDGNAVSSNIEAAIRKGQLSAFSTLGQAFDEHPFWMSKNGLLGLCASDSGAEFLEKLGKLEVVWLSIDEALSLDWDAQAGGTMLNLASEYRSILKEQAARLDSVIEKAELVIEIEREDG